MRPLARLVIRAFANREDRLAIEGDLAETYGSISGARGRVSADLWLLGQIALVAAHGTWSSVRQLSTASVAVRWIGRDIRHAARGLIKTPGFTTAAVLSLAIGIGAATGMFGLVYAVLWEPLAIPQPDRLVMLERASRDRQDDGFSAADFASLSAATGGDLALFRDVDNVPFQFGPERDYVTTHFVQGFFQTLRLRPLAGRFIDAADEQSAAPVVVISEPLWERRFDRDARAIGRAITIGRLPFTIVGIAPASFRGVDYPGSFSAAIPLSAARAAGLQDPLHDTEPTLNIVGRLPDRADAATTTARWNDAFQRSCRHAETERLTLVDASHGIGGKDDMRSELHGLLVALLVSVVFVLMMASVNVANLLIVRSERRARELALRLSLGASRARIAQQLLTEAALLSTAGAAAGLMLAAAGRMALTRNMPRNVNVMTEVMRFHVDMPVVLCALAAAFVSVTIAGLLPSLRAARAAVIASTRTGARATSSGGGWIERAGVVVQVALALLVVTAGGLLAITLRNLTAIDPGIRPEHVYLAQVETRGTSLEAVGMVPIHKDMLDRVRALPGVEHAAFATYVPFFGGRRATRTIALPASGADPIRSVVLDAVTPGFFDAAGTPLVAGRDFSADDSSGAAHVVIVTESVARRLGGGADLIGRRIAISQPVTDPATVIGIARDSKLSDIRSEAPAVMYMPVTQTGAWPFLEVVVRARRVPADFGRQMAVAMNAAAPDARVRFATTLETELSASMSRERFAATLATLFAGIALGLASLGLYALVSQQVARRRSELAVRVALGARGRSLISLVAWPAAKLVAAGCLAGLPLAILPGRMMAADLYGVRSAEPAIVAASAVILVVAAIVAVTLPARRASRTDPLDALKGAD